MEIQQTHTRPNLSSYEASLRAAYQLIQNGKSYSLIALPFTSETTACFDRLNISTTANFDHFGSLDTLERRLHAIAYEFGSNSQALCGEFASSLSSIVAQSVRALGKESAWVCIRSFLPESEPYVGRWHTDGNFFTPSLLNETQVKLAFVVRGRSTLFATLDPERCIEFNERQRALSIVRAELSETNASDKEKLRQFAHNLQIDINNCVPSENVITAQPQIEGALFAVGGDAGHSAIHSEPPLDMPRVFVSIVPGSMRQIEELKTRRTKRD